MPLTRFEKIVLGISGTTALAIGAFILSAPHAFYAGYGISLGETASLLSELRAFAASLAVLGLLMLAGIWRAQFGQVAVTASLTVFLAFPAGRIIGLLVDGTPSSGILIALVVELAIGTLCLAAFRHRLKAPGPFARRSSAA